MTNNFEYRKHNLQLHPSVETLKRSEHREPRLKEAAMWPINRF